MNVWSHAEKKDEEGAKEKMEEEETNEFKKDLGVEKRRAGWILCDIINVPSHTKYVWLSQATLQYILIQKLTLKYGFPDQARLCFD